MKSRKPINLEAIRVARRKLRELVQEHPHLRGDPSAENRAGWEATLNEDEGRQMAATKQVAFRLEAELVERVNAYAKRLEQERPGLEFSRADAVRVLLTRALDEADAAGGKRGRTSSKR